MLTAGGNKVDFGKLSLAARINYADDERGLGVSETGSFEGNYPPVKKGVVFNWVQIITTNGFNIDKEKTRTVSGISELNAPVLLTQKFLTANFNGWTLASPGSCCVPEPCAGFAIMIMLTMIQRRPTRRHPCTPIAA